MRVVIAGGGISGASLARFLADRNVRSELHERSESVGGMCREIQWNNALVPETGPHIFRTSDPAVWAFFSRFAPMVERPHTVATVIDGSAVPFPPLLDDGTVIHGTYASVGDYVLAAVGEDLFRRFYDDYTRKRWGVSAFSLSPDMIPLIPVRRYRSGFFSDARIGIPQYGYSRAIANMVDHPNIRVHLRSTVSAKDVSSGETLVWTGPLDTLGSDVPVPAGLYRCVSQVFEPAADWPDDAAPVLNYPGTDVPYIRRTNYRLLLPWQPDAIGKEFSDDRGYPAYPLRTHTLVERITAFFSALKRRHHNIVPHGRLGRFQYISMDQAIAASSQLAEHLTTP